MVKKAVQRGRSKRGGQGYSVRYVKSPSAARTKLADFFNILLEFGFGNARVWSRPTSRRDGRATRPFGPGGRLGGPVAMLAVGLNDILNQPVTNHVPIVKIHKLDSFNFPQNIGDLDEARGSVRWQVYLGDITGHNGL